METILVVEDEPLVGEEIREDLERLGYRVPAVVTSGDDVMEAVARYKPDLILMDVRIEGSMDGIEAAYTAKAEFDVPIIYLTAYSDTETIERASSTNPAAYLLKPFDEREVAANVALALSNARAKKSGREELLHNAPLVDALETAALLVDASGKIAHVNVKAARLYNVRNMERLYGRNLSDLIENSESVPSSGRGRVRLGGLHGIEAEASVEPLRLPDGKTIGSLVLIDPVGRDERRLLEDSVAAINEVILSRFPTATAAGDGYLVDGFLLPSTSGSGDLFGACPLCGQSALLFAIDVMGHGALASMYAFALGDLIQEFATTASVDEPIDPALLARRLNERMSGGAENPSFFSATFILLNRPNGEYRIVRAGHPPVLHVSSDGIARELKPAGAALGAFSSIEFEEARGKLESGDRLIICSDGLAEALGGNLGNGISTVAAAAAEFRTPESLAGALRDRIHASSHAHSTDDIGCLILGRV